MSQDAFGGSSIEEGATIIPFDLRQDDFQHEGGTTSTICWRQAISHVEIHELSTCHKPIKSRFIVAHGSSLNDQNQRRDFTPDSKGGSTSQHRSQGMIRLSCSLAVGCGVSLRPIARLFSSLCLMPMTQASRKRWLDDLGAHRPTPEEMLRQWLALAPATEWQSDGYDPMGPDRCVMGVQEEPARMLMTPAVESENGEEARKFLERWKALGLHGTAAWSDDSQSFTEAIKAVSPQARLQADHFHTVKKSWGHLKTSLLAYRRKSKASGEAKPEEVCMALAKQWWPLCWSLLKTPGNVSGDAKQAMAELESDDEGFVHSVRSLLRQLGHIFDHAHSAAQAKRRRQQRRKDSQALADPQLEKMPQCFDDPWDHALRYLRNKGMSKHRRGSTSEAGMRLLRRLEKNHDGIRSAAPRQYYMQIYQAMKYLSLDVADFIEKGPQRAALPCV
jgi:Transposase